MNKDKIKQDSPVPGYTGRRQRKDGHMEENTQKFDERLKELVALGKKKKSILELQEINDFFNDMELDAEQMEKVFEHLEVKQY